MPSVSYRKNPAGTRWHIRFRQSGHKEIVKSYPISLQERTIEKKAAWWEQQIALGYEDPWNTPQTEGIRLEAAIKLYIDDGISSGEWKTDAEGHSKTARGKRNRLKRLIEKFGNIDVEYLDPDEMSRWLIRRKKRTKEGAKTHKRLSPVTIKSHATTYNAFFKWLHKNRYTENLKSIYLSTNIKSAAKQIIKQPSGISLKQVKSFCEAASKRAAKTAKQPRYAKRETLDWIILCANLTFWLMLRRDEIINIYPEDISEDMEYFTYGSEGREGRPKFVPKSGIETLPLLEPARKVFQQMDVHSLPDKPIFDYSYDYIGVAFSRVSKMAFDRKTFSPHTFRHGGIIHLRSVLKQPGLVSRLARHSSQQVTDRHYGGVDPVYLKRAIKQEGL